MKNQELQSQRLDHLGIVAGICDEIGLSETIDSQIKDNGRKVSVGQAVKAMILNGLGFVSRPLYLSPEFFHNKPVELLVGADGALSRIKQWGEFASCEWDYEHQALVATIEVEQSHQHTAWQRFRPEGPLALLPLAADNDRTCSIVWSTNDEECQQLLSLAEEEFCAALSAASEQRLGKVLKVGPRMAFPLRQRHAKMSVIAQTCVVGIGVWAYRVMLYL